MLQARLLAAGLMALILTLTIIAPLLDPTTGAGIYNGFSHICHQKADRCLFISDHPMAICARCTAIYAGIGIGTLTIPLLSLSFRKVYIGFLVVASAMIGLDVLAEWLGMYENFLPSRLLTGFIFGISLSPFLLSATLELTGSKPTTHDSSTR